MSYKKLVYRMVCFLVIFLFFHLFIYYGYTGEPLELPDKLLKKSAFTGRHEPGKTVEVTTFGDLARLSHLYRLGIRRTVTDTSDSLGHLNPDYHSGKVYPVVTVGDSFMRFNGDGHRFDDLLEEKLGVPCYNMAAKGVEDPFVFLRSNFKNEAGVLVWESVERNVRAGAFNAQKINYYRQLAEKKAAYQETWADKSYRPKKFRQVNSTNVKFIINNIYFSLWGTAPLGDVRIARLQDGGKLLYYHEDLIYFQRPGFDEDLARAVEFVCRVDRELQENGVRLVFLLVPDKYNAYYAQIKPGEKPPRDSGFMRRLVEELQKNGVLAINLIDPYREMINGGIDPYHPDDTHWNSAGADRAAELVAAAIREHRLLR